MTPGYRSACGLFVGLAVLGLGGWQRRSVPLPPQVRSGIVLFEDANYGGPLPRVHGRRHGPARIGPERPHLECRGRAGREVAALRRSGLPRPVPARHRQRSEPARLRLERPDHVAAPRARGAWTPRPPRRQRRGAGAVCRDPLFGTAQDHFRPGRQLPGHRLQRPCDERARGRRRQLGALRERRLRRLSRDQHRRARSAVDRAAAAGLLRTPAVRRPGRLSGARATGADRAVRRPELHGTVDDRRPAAVLARRLRQPGAERASHRPMGAVRRDRYRGRCSTITNNVRDLRELRLDNRVQSVRPR